MIIGKVYYNIHKYFLENKLKDILIHKESIVTSLLEGKNIEKDIISAVWPALLDKFYLIDIYIESKLYDAYLYIKSLIKYMIYLLLLFF